MTLRKYLLLLVFPLTLSSQLRAADSTITVTGQVQDNTCVLSTATQDLTVNLMSYALKQFSEKGAAGAFVPFTLNFSQCGSSATAVRIGFTGYIRQ